MLLEKKWQLRQVLILGALVMLSLCGGILLSAMVGQFTKPHLSADYATLVTLVIGFMSFQGTALIWVHFFLKAHGTTWGEGFGFSRGNSLGAIKAAIIALPIVLVGVFALGAVSDWGLQRLHQQLHWAWLKPEPQVAVKLLQNSWPLHLIIVQGIVAIVIAPLAEEILFRGILYTTLKQSGRKGLALFLPAVFFSLIHFYPVGFLSLIFLALALVVVYERTGNLLAPILLHALFNAVNFLLIVTQPSWATDIFKP